MKIICIGWNYVDHTKELNTPVPEVPVFFLKPDSCIIKDNKPFCLPDFSNEIHHEVEIVLKINRLGKHIAEKFAHRYYDEIGLGIDFTARDIQRKCKQDGAPWEIAKAFDGAAPLGKFVSKDAFSDMENIPFSLEKNGQLVQVGNTRDMMFNFNKIIEHVSKYMTLKIGDLIFTGTPVGVSSVAIGDHLTGYIGDDKFFDFSVK